MRTSSCIEVGAICERCLIMASMTRTRRDEADCAVQVFIVVPIRKALDTDLSICLSGEALGRPFRAVFASSEQGF